MEYDNNARQARSHFPVGVFWKLALGILYHALALVVAGAEIAAADIATAAAVTDDRIIQSHSNNPAIDPLSSSSSSSSSSGSSTRHFSFPSSINTNFELSTNIVSPEFCDPNSPLSLSGYFGVKGSKYDTENSKHYFYWFFERREKSLLPPKDEKDGLPNLQQQRREQQQEQQTENSKEEVPFVIWLNGGPGCSSLLGLLQENGPCLVNDDGHSTTLNPYSWTEVAHVLYLDQPAKTGYSYGAGNDRDEDMVAEDAYYFIQAFFQSEEGEKYKDLPLYLTGESYAGHYLPAIAHKIWKENQKLSTKEQGDLLQLPFSKKGLLHLPLSGVAIGNGSIDIQTQMKWFAEMAFNNPHGIQLINKEEYEDMKAAAKSCAKDAHKCKMEKEPTKKEDFCQMASDCEEDFFSPLLDQNISIYDITKPCYNPLCEDMTPIETFLNLKSTKETLGVPADVTWDACDDYVSEIWSDIDRVGNFAPYVSELLNNNIPVLIYAGDLDYICNYMGNRDVTLKLEWNHGNDFRSAKDHDWNNGGGWARSSNGLSFLQVYDAGHMVPQDQPEQALKMFTQFLNGD
eukprot:CAMPEP_0183706806 /NCGR_PEP_ID=MMETSP0737-20130205/3538_1 /TAXON_ID=385413 /ORGANISM="Thalassiosira miniscula, Strain CCMP1093" /LENGTH=570 /DNA_ID=CAMNT_0025934319 /DNA_START=79 /DNA_END=1788 /DNA_ORIENTATION=+